MNVEIPPGLTDLLQGFTVAVLRAKPEDLISFAAHYFNDLDEKRQNKNVKTKGVSFGGASPEDYPMQTEDSDEEPMPGRV